MDDNERAGRPLSGQNPRLSRVIRGDAVGGDVPLSDKPVLRPPPRGQVLNAEEFEAHSAAKQIIIDAQKKAEEILAEANRQKAELFAKTRDEAKAEVAAKTTEELARAKLQAGEILRGAEPQIVELALKVAQKIIGRDLERDSEVLMEIAASAVEHARSAKAMILRLNPKDGAVLREKKPRLMELIGRSVDLAIRDDADVEAGGCIVQTEFGTIDAQLKTQYEMLRNVLMPDDGKKEGPK